VITVWVLLLVCSGPRCGPAGGEIKGIYTTLGECTDAAKKQRRQLKAVCMQAIVEEIGEPLGPYGRSTWRAVDSR